MKYLIQRRIYQILLRGKKEIDRMMFPINIILWTILLWMLFVLWRFPQILEIVNQRINGSILP